MQILSNNLKHFFKKFFGSEHLNLCKIFAVEGGQVELLERHTRWRESPRNFKRSYLK